LGSQQSKGLDAVQQGSGTRDWLRLPKILSLIFICQWSDNPAQSFCLALTHNPMKKTKTTIKYLTLALLSAGLYSCGGGPAVVDNISVPLEDTTATEVVETVPEVSAAVDHSGWDALLQKHVSAEGNVNYEAMQADFADVDMYLALLGAGIPDATWSREDAMCYWINAYNAYTVKLILDNYPLESITNLDGGEVWKREWIDIAGTTYSLNAIENDILRPTYNDARVHFAINCASYSCPRLWNKAFTPENLEAQLEVLAKEFVNDAKRNTLSADAPEISSIFTWYEADFIADGTVIDFLNKYAEIPVNADATIGYMEYDWNLNQ
jgi:hypothetical protein